jgi:hypothetical protein
VTACLSDEDVLAFVDGELPDGRRGQADAHLSACADCRAVVAEAARSLFETDSRPRASATTHARTWREGPLRPPAQPLAPDDRVGRYQVRRMIGAGGAGVVYEAFDPQLGRRIALKMLRPDGGSWLTRGPRRLLREARAMARLAHPNVVNVHDAGTHLGEVFIALEYVDGRTVARWLRETRPDWREIVRVFVDAGQGLAAAHRARLVHGDFKPENVLIAGDGRARVTDFGLARLDTDPLPDPRAPSEPPAGEPSLFTQTGALVGTPAYMAPEQFQGARPDERTDQFNFAAALYRSLYELRPFGGDRTEPATVDTLAREVIAGQLHQPVGTAVPGAVFAVVRRGLSGAPAERFPSMDALLESLAATLASGPGEKRRPARRWLVAPALAALAMGAVALRPRRVAVAPAPVMMVVAPPPRPEASLPVVRAEPTIIAVRRPHLRPPASHRPPAPPPIAAPDNSERYGHRLKDPFASPRKP